MEYSDNYTKEEKKQLAKDKVEKALAKIKADVVSVFDNSTFPDYLKFAANLHYFDVNNTLLIYKQRPDAVFLASFRVWEKLSAEYWGDANHSVFASSQKGKGIGILAPYILKKTLDKTSGQKSLGISYLDYHVVFVFDQTQTNNIPAPTTAWDISSKAADGAALFAAFKEKAPFDIVFSPEGKAPQRYLYENKLPPEKDSLILNFKDKNDYYLLCSYVIKPFVLHSLKNTLKSHSDADIQKICECTSFMVANYFGLPTNEYIFFFIEQWGENNPKKELEILKVVQGAAHWLIDTLEDEMLFYKSTYETEDFFDNNDIFEFNASFGF